MIYGKNGGKKAFFFSPFPAEFGDSEHLAAFMNLQSYSSLTSPSLADKWYRGWQDRSLQYGGKSCGGAWESLRNSGKLAN
ncbi:MAG: hypothetical protein QF541_19015 [Lentisphaeria bacterium]|nr:hypothetical protein [Lentisphaeria bacterium]